MTLTALLLTGGLSRRMGRDKATLLIKGEPLWARQIALLRELRPEAIWVSARAVPNWAPQGIEVVLDQSPSRGPLSGIAAALASIQSTHLLALAVDLPRMSSSHLRRLMELTQPGRGVIPSNLDQFEPLSAIYPKAAAPVAQSALASGNYSMRSFGQQLQRQNLLEVYFVVPEERSLYHNLNTTGDLVA